MVKRLNYIQQMLNAYDPVKTRRIYKNKLDSTKNQRIWEIWKQELN